MPQFYLIAIAAGAASGVLHLAISFGGISGLILGYLATLPLFLAGLSSGWSAALIAGLAGGIVTLVAGGLPFAALYLASYALPAAFLCRQALLSRTNSNGDVEWYPVGHLVLCLLGMASGLFLLVFAYLEFFAGGLLEAATELLTAYGKFMGPEAMEGFAMGMAPSVPAIGVVSWIMLIFVNGVLAQGLLVRGNRNYRPSPRLGDITYPLWLLPAFIGTIFLSYFDGNLALFGKTLAVIGAVAYFLLGLGVLHGFFQRVSVGLPLKILFYGFVLPLVWPVSLVLVAAGLMRHINQLRRPNDDGGRKET